MVSRVVARGGGGGGGGRGGGSFPLEKLRRGNTRQVVVGEGRGGEGCGM